jgi:hypothetical protein
MTERHDAPSSRALRSRAWRLADDLYAESERLRGVDEARASEMFWQGDHLRTLAERGRDIGAVLDHEVRARYGLAEEVA